MVLYVNTIQVQTVNPWTLKIQMNSSVCGNEKIVHFVATPVEQLQLNVQAEL